MLKLSIIIPCYNHGKYLQEAIDSLPSPDDLSYELIIVNDGSTELFTITELDRLKDLGYTIIAHKNRGLAYSRNAGIDLAKGYYILPLDADNKLIASSVIEAITLLDNGDMDIVYGDPKFIGEDIASRKFVPKPFEGDELFFTNYIDACAIFKKSVWEKNKGYDSGMPYQGNEDWDFWLGAYLHGAKFHYLEKYCYEYRITADSMLGAIINNEKRDANLQYIVNKYYQGLVEAYMRHYAYSSIYRNDIKHPLRSAVKYFYHILK